eukprot:gene21947-28415_t
MMENEDSSGITSEEIDSPIRSSTKKVLRLKRARILAAVIGIGMIYVVLFFTSSTDSDFLIAGGVVGTVSSILVLIGLMRHKEILGPHTSLLFWRSVCDLGLGLRFIATPGFNLLLCNAVQCTRSNANVNMCPLQSAICEFFSITTETWFLCNGVDLYVSITNPFSAFKDRIFYYHIFSWSTGIIFSVAPFFSSNISSIYGFWYVDGNDKELSVCWIATNSLRSPVWGMFFAPVFVIYMLCILSLYLAYIRLKLGVTKTFLPRMKLLITNTTNVFILIFYWFFICIFYTLAYASQNGDFNRIVLLLLSSKGFSAFFVYVIVIDMNLKLTKENQENMEANTALREEVLNFATAGIRSSTREAHKAKPERLKVSRRPKQVHSDDSSKLITPLFFFRFVLGLPMEVAAVEKLINANTRRVNPSYHKQIRASQSLEALVDIGHSKQERKSSVRLSQRATVVTGGMLQSIRDVENPVILSHLELEEAAAVGQAMNKTRFGNDAYQVRPSEMVEVPSESAIPVEDLNETYEEDPESASSGSNKFGISCLERLLYYFRAPIFDQSDWVEFTEFAPHYFREIRYSAGITDEVYIDFFSMTIKERLTEGGASGAFFFFSKDEMFIAKSCTQEELETLKSNAQKYSAYMCANKNSYISRIYGAYRLQIYGNSLCFFVMNNIFLNPQNLSMNEKYDIKGSWVNRNAKPPRNGQTATCTFCEQKFVFWKKRSKLGRRLNDDKVNPGEFKRSMFDNKPQPSEAAIASAIGKASSMELSQMGEDASLDRGDISSCPYTVTGVHEPNVIMKDSDLKYKIRLPLEVAMDLLKQIQMDADFLLSLGIMDYSLLVGVNNSEYEVLDRSSPGVSPMKSTSEPSVPESLMSSRKLEVFRVVGPCAYYMGIIDFQQKWNFGKKVDPDGLSAIRPEVYRDRFIRKIEDILDFENLSKPSASTVRVA